MTTNCTCNVIKQELTCKHYLHVILQILLPTAGRGEVFQFKSKKRMYIYILT